MNMKKKIPARKFQDGDMVMADVPFTEKQTHPYKIIGARWTGITWMYEFENAIFRYGESYLSKKDINQDEDSLETNLQILLNNY